MTSSPAPDLDELERLFDSAVGADFLPVGWQAVFGYVPALITELRAARELGVAYVEMQRLHIALGDESGRLREALRRVVDWWDLEPPDFMEKYGTLNTDKALGPARALLATPPAPSDYGADLDDSRELRRWVYALHECLPCDDHDEIEDDAEPLCEYLAVALRDRINDPAFLATPAVPPEEGT